MPLILALFLLKVALSFYGNPQHQTSEKRPPQLSLTTLKKYYNGDLFYRLHTLELEHLGDLNGERKSLSTYSPQTLKNWFQSIDALTSTPDLLPFLVTFYYSSSLNLRPLCIDFLETHCDHNPRQKWRWLAHGYALSQLTMPSQRLATKLSTYGKVYNLPLWIKDTKARYHQKQGDTKNAQALFKAILTDPKSTLSPEEKDFLKVMMS